MRTTRTLADLVRRRRWEAAQAERLRAAAEELDAEELYAGVALENDPTPSRAHASWHGSPTPGASVGAPVEIRARRAGQRHLRLAAGVPAGWAPVTADRVRRYDAEHDGDDQQADVDSGGGRR